MQDSHRLFLQTFMSHGILSSTRVKETYKMAVERYQGDVQMGGTQLAEFVQTINVAIKSMNLQIRKAVSEDTGKQFYVLANQQESDITKLASDYSASELELFKKIVEAVVTSDTGSMSSIDALNIEQAKDVKKMTKKDIEALLKRMEYEKWLDINRQGEISLSTRSILELDQYIEEQFPDHAIKCDLCKRLCVKGQFCANCDVKLHLFCAAKYFRDGKECKCPSPRCSEPWTHAVPMIAESQASPRKQASQSASSQSQSTRRSARH